MVKKKSVLVVDDSKDMLELLRRNTTLMGFNSFAAINVIDAIEVLENTPIELVITDLNMPGIGGEQLVRYISQHFPEIPVLVITGFPDVRNAVEVMQMGAMEYLVKPFTYDELEISIHKVIGSVEIENIDKQVEAPKKRSKFHGIIGQSPVMQQLFNLIEKTNNNQASILITGESGTGKEMVARAIHYNSKFSTAPFVAVNCGAIPDQLLESELFGHLKGAFTGASQSRVGFFQAANGGSLFLDEITNTSLSVQAKLLRAIQEKEVTMVGDHKPHKVSLRIISASNSDIEDLVSRELFREDLYYRLNVIKIEIPPLRERVEDIPLLLDVFIKKYSKELDKKPPRMPKPIMRLFEDYQWPGNVRELENLIHRLVILAEAKITMELIPNHMKINVHNENREQLLTLAQAEKQHILKVLSATENNKSKAAKILDIDRKTLRNKLK